MEESTTSPNPVYSREKWKSLSIQERIKAMNGTVDLGDQTTFLVHGDPQEPLPAPVVQEPEPSRRRSVVEMWRQRDNNRHTASASEGSDHGQEEKKDEEPGSDGVSAVAASTVVTKPSQARNVWSQRTKTTSDPSVHSPPKPTSVKQTTQSVGAKEVDMTIVPSPAKKPTPESHETEDARPPSPKTRPSNVVDFWARQGLKPMSGPTPGKLSSPWNNRSSTALSSRTEGSVASAEVDSTASSPLQQPKVSVVDRWKQRVNGQDESQTPEPPAPKKPISDRWTAAVKKPEPAENKPRSKITDRWLNRPDNQTQQSPVRRTKAFTPKKQPHYGIASVPAGVASPASRSRTTASTTGSWPSEATTEEDDDVRTTVESVTTDNHASSQTHFLDGTFTETPGSSPHVTRRWSNRFGDEVAPPDAKAPAEEPCQLNSRGSPSLPEPRRKKSERSSPTEANEGKQERGSSNDKPMLQKPSPKTDSSLTTPSVQRTGQTWKGLGSTEKSPGSAVKLRYEAALKKKGTSLDGAGLDSSAGSSTPKLLVLISGQSFNRGQNAINQQITTILNSHGIPFEEIDGSVLNVRERRNELFKVSGLWAKYPQFFVRQKDETIFWGTWDTFEQCNDSGRIAAEFAPEPDLEPPLLERKSAPVEKGEHLSLPAPKRTPRSGHDTEEGTSIPSAFPLVNGNKTSGHEMLRDGRLSPRGRMRVPVANTSSGVHSVENDHASPAKAARSDDLYNSFVNEKEQKERTPKMAEGSSGDPALSDFDEILQPSQPANAGTPTETSWPQTKEQLDRNLQNPSPATTCSGASVSQSSQTSSARGRRDFHSLKARRIGQRLIEKKRELQAHRLRMRNNQSTDSNDASLSETNYKASIEPMATTSAEEQGVQALRRNPPQQQNNWTANDKARGPSGPQVASPRKQALRVSTDPPAKSPAAANVRSPMAEAGFAFLSSPTKSDGGDSVSSRGSSALSIRAEKVLKQRRQKGYLENVDEAPEWDDDRMHAQELTRNVLYGRPLSGKHESPMNQLRVETEESNFNSSRSDTYVSSRRSSSVRSYGQHDPHTPSRRVATPTGRLEQDRSPFSGLDNETMPNDWNSHQRFSPQGANHFSRPRSSSGAVGHSPSMTRQRASLSTRYRTSERFMDEPDLQIVASPKSTKSLPNARRNGKQSSRLDSTRSAPSRRYYDEPYSSYDTQDHTPTSSADLQSSSSQASRNRRSRLRQAHSEMDSTFDGRSVRSSNYGINEEFAAKSANDYGAFQSAYSSMTFGQLAADFAGEVSSALNFERLQEDVKLALQGVSRTNSEPVPQKTKQPVMVVPDMAPFDEEDVAIEVEYMESPEDDTVTTPPSADLSAEGQPHRRRRRAADV